MLKASYSNSISKVKQACDEQATKIVGARRAVPVREEAKVVSAMNLEKAVGHREHRVHRGKTKGCSTHTSHLNGALGTMRFSRFSLCAL